MSPPPYSSQPRKTIYLLYQLWSTVFVRIPLWTLLAIPKFQRPRPSWSLARVVRLHLIKHLSHIGNQTGGFGRSPPNHLAIAPCSTPGFSGIWIDHISNDLFTEPLRSWASQNNVERANIPGYWMRRRDASPSEGGKTMLFMHGGGYVLMSGHPDDMTGNITKGLLEHVPAVKQILSVEYRLSKPGENAFPAALMDALAAYELLVVKEGISPGDIVLVGDSAGGNLAMALTRYLVAYRAEWLPVGVILFSPWGDLGTSHWHTGTMASNRASDFLNEKVLVNGREWVCGAMGAEEAETHAYISPATLKADVKFTGFPRMFVTCGGAEMLADMIQVVRDRLVRDIGKEKVVYLEVPDAFHDYLAFPKVHPEGKDTYMAIAEWMDIL